MVSLLIARALLKLPCGANSIVGLRGRVILYQNFAYELKRYAHVAFNDPAPGIAPATAWFLPFARATRSASAVKILASSKRSIASRPGKGSLDPPSAQDCLNLSTVCHFVWPALQIVWAQSYSPKGFQVSPLPEKEALDTYSRATRPPVSTPSP